VRVSAPAATDVGVRIRTFYGTDLHVVGSTLRGDSCNTKQGQMACVFRFPALEAQRAGRWTVIVMKTSRPPASVAVKVTFKPLPG
jgi:hypothetical protein